MKRSPIRRSHRSSSARSGGVPRNPKHLDVIRSLPCILAGDPRHECRGRVEAAHAGWGRGRGQKAPDETAIPMCSALHRTGKYSQHAIPKTFWSYWNLDRSALIEKYAAMTANDPESSLCSVLFVEEL